jgi:uncharacterized OB-fold protein
MPERPMGPTRDLPRRPVPVAHEHERPFWTGGARGELTVQRCRECGGLNHPPTMRCRHDHSADLEWTVLSGRGQVEGWAVTQHQWLPDFPAPYVVALVALDEDPRARLLSNIVHVDPGEIRHGMAVQVTFVRTAVPDGEDDDEVWLPLFEPAVGP